MRTAVVPAPAPITVLESPDLSSGQLGQLRESKGEADSQRWTMHSEHNMTRQARGASHTTSTDALRR